MSWVIGAVVVIAFIVWVIRNATPTEPSNVKPEDTCLVIRGCPRCGEIFHGTMNMKEHTPYCARHQDLMELEIKMGKREGPANWRRDCAQCHVEIKPGDTLCRRCTEKVIDRLLTNRNPRH